MGRRPGRERVRGPYDNGDGRWLVEHITGPRSEPGARVPHYFDSEAEAEGFVDELTRDIAVTAIGISTVDDVLTRYRKHLIAKGNKEGSVDETIRRMRQFFEPVLSLRADLLTPPRGARLYQQIVEATVMKPIKGAEPDKEGNVPFEEVPRFAVATHRNQLLQARSFTRWCVSQRIMRRDPLAAVKGVGKIKKGKDQLRIDEARIWAAKALELAQGGDAGALAALMSLYMANRSSEVTNRRVNDIDDDGTILWVEEGKTDKSNGTVSIPEELQPLFQAQVKGRDREEFIFPAEPKKDGTVGPHWRDWVMNNTKRICRLAGVREVCAHSMRGLHSTLAFERGTVGALVAESLRHTNVAITTANYAKRDAVKKGTQRRALTVLAGGKK